MLIDHILKTVSAELAFVFQDVVVRWSGCSLNRFMGTEIEIIFKRMSYISLHQCSWKWILWQVTRVQEKSNVVPLLSNYNSEFWLGKWSVLARVLKVI